MNIVIIFPCSAAFPETAHQLMPGNIVSSTSVRSTDSVSATAMESSDIPMPGNVVENTAGCSLDTGSATTRDVNDREPGMHGSLLAVKKGPKNYIEKYTQFDFDRLGLSMPSVMQFADLVSIVVDLDECTVVS